MRVCSGNPKRATLTQARARALNPGSPRGPFFSAIPCLLFCFVCFSLTNSAVCRRRPAGVYFPSWAQADPSAPAARFGAAPPRFPREDPASAPFLREGDNLLLPQRAPPPPPPTRKGEQPFARAEPRWAQEPAALPAVVRFAPRGVSFASPPRCAPRLLQRTHAVGMPTTFLTRVSNACVRPCVRPVSVRAGRRQPPGPGGPAAGPRPAVPRNGLRPGVRPAGAVRAGPGSGGGAGGEARPARGAGGAAGEAPGAGGDWGGGVWRRRRDGGRGRAGGRGEAA